MSQEEEDVFIVVRLTAREVYALEFAHALCLAT